MRLIKQLERIEAAAAAVAPDSGAVPVGLAWSNCDARVDAAQLLPGEYIAADVHVLANACPGVEDWSILERITCDAGDLGFVYDGAGARVGRVVAMDGSLLTLRYEAEE